MKETFKDIYSHGTVEKHCIKNPQKDQRVLTPRIKSEKIYYTMPLYSGEELLTYLTKFKFNLESKSDRAIVLNIMLKIAQEIQKIHQLDYVHLDIKPDNVIIQHNKDKNSLNIRLIDWDFLHKKSTVLRYKMGTERYRHPEVRIGSSVQPKFDVYSLGIFFNDIKEIFKISELEELITLMLNDNINIDEVIEKLSKLLKSNKFEEMTSNTDIESSSMCFLDPQLVKKDSSFQRHTLV
jgi:serine/threonine protein kinase